MPIDRKEPMSSDDRVFVCECPISYHVEQQRDHMVAVLDRELPTIMDMCFGRCERCGLPFHNDFEIAD